MTDPSPAPATFQPAYQPAWPPPRRRNRRLLATVLAVSIAAASGIGGGVVGLHLSGTDNTTATATPGATTASPITSGYTIPEVVAKVSPSVVSIAVAGNAGTAEGSGVILTADGLIVTNAHVVSGAGTVRVTFADGRKVAASVVGSDSTADLAVLRAQGVSGLTPA